MTPEENRVASMLSLLVTVIIDLSVLLSITFSQFTGEIAPDFYTTPLPLMVLVQLLTPMIVRVMA
jgi:hypothetical protein